LHEGSNHEPTLHTPLPLSTFRSFTILKFTTTISTFSNGEPTSGEPTSITDILPNGEPTYGEHIVPLPALEHGRLFRAKLFEHFNTSASIDGLLRTTTSPEPLFFVYKYPSIAIAASNVTTANSLYDACYLNKPTTMTTTIDKRRLQQISGTFLDLASQVSNQALTSKRRKANERINATQKTAAASTTAYDASYNKPNIPNASKLYDEPTRVQLPYCSDNAFTYCKPMFQTRPNSSMQHTPITSPTSFPISRV